MTNDDGDGVFQDLLQEMSQGDLGDIIGQGRGRKARHTAEAVADSEKGSGEAGSAPEPELRTYSELLRAIPVEERTLVVERYEEAVRRGVIRVVPLAGERFPVRVGGGGPCPTT